MLAKAGRPWARLMPLEGQAGWRRSGVLREQMPLPPPEVLLESLPEQELAAPERLSPAVAAALAEQRVEVLVSVASAWEIATKHRIGKLPSSAVRLEGWQTLLDGQGFCHLAISHGHAIRAGGYGLPYRDPFDRLLAAQAELEQLALVTADPALVVFPCQVLW